MGPAVALSLLLLGLLVRERPRRCRKWSRLLLRLRLQLRLWSEYSRRAERLRLCLWLRRPCLPVLRPPSLPLLLLLLRSLRLRLLPRALVPLRCEGLMLLPLGTLWRSLPSPLPSSDLAPLRVAAAAAAAAEVGGLLNAAASARAAATAAATAAAAALT